MKKLVVILFLLLPACTTQQSGVVGQILTGTLINPISQTNIYELKNVYAIAAQSAVSYRGYCYARPYATLMADPIAGPICKDRRAIVRTIQKYKNTAFAAVVAAANFVKANPTLDATVLINTAWSSVTALQNAIPKVPA